MAALLGMSALTGCGGAKTQTGTESGADTKVYKVGVVQYADHPSLITAARAFWKD